MIYTNRRSPGRTLVEFVLDLDAITEAHAAHQNIEDALLLKERRPLQVLKLLKARRARISSRRSRGG